LLVGVDNPNELLALLIGMVGENKLMGSEDAASVLISLGPKVAPAIEPLRTRLRAKNPALRSLAMTCLGNMGASARPAVPKLDALTRHPDVDVDVRREAALTLWKIGVREERIRSLIRESIPTSVKEDMTPGTALSRIEILRELGDAARDERETLHKYLRNAAADIELQTNAAIALIEFDPKDETAKALLVERMKSEESGGFRYYAALAAAGALLDTESHRKEASHRIVEWAQEKDGHRFLWALSALPQTSLSLDDKLKLLTPALHDADPFTRQMACRSIGLIGPPAKKAKKDLEPLLKDPDLYVRLQTRIALKATGPD
jgi:HEAT repeat protein